MQAGAQLGAGKRRAQHVIAAATRATVVNAKQARHSETKQLGTAGHS